MNPLIFHSLTRHVDGLGIKESKLHFCQLQKRKTSNRSPFVTLDTVKLTL